jgi:hypothetical protein
MAGRPLRALRSRLAKVGPLALILLLAAAVQPAAAAPQVRADFNGDGRSDLAVGAPFEDSGSTTDVGVVNVLYGSASRLQVAGAQQFTQATTGGLTERGDQFGFALAARDFNGDGRSDLAVGAPFEDSGSTTDVGVVNVLYGSASGLRSAGARQFTQSDAGGNTEPGDQFGFALAAGDFNGDGRSDLGVGADLEDQFSIRAVGAVNVLYGSSSGLESTGAQQFTQSAAGGTTERADLFGFALAAGDFNGDGRFDLAAGAPTESSSSTEFFGAVNVLYGSPNRLQTTGAQEFTQASAGGTREPFDGFGTALAAGDFDGDGRSDLAVGASGEQVGSAASAGVVNVIYGSANRLQTTGAQQFTQSDAGGNTEQGDQFGRALATGDFNGDGRFDLGVGAFSEDGLPRRTCCNEDIGAVNVLYGSASRLQSTGAQQFIQADAGGNPELGDVFGAALTTGDFNGDGRSDLAVGAPNENAFSTPTVGVVNLLYGSASRLQSTGAQQFTQSDAGGLTEEGDQFGFGLG